MFGGFQAANDDAGSPNNRKQQRRRRRSRKEGSSASSTTTTTAGSTGGSGTQGSSEDEPQPPVPGRSPTDRNVVTWSDLLGDSSCSPLKGAAAAVSPTAASSPLQPVVCTAPRLGSPAEDQYPELHCREWSSQWPCAWSQAPMGYGDMGMGIPPYGGGHDMGQAHYAPAPGPPSPTGAAVPWTAETCAAMGPWACHGEFIALEEGLTGTIDQMKEQQAAVLLPQGQAPSIPSPPVVAPAPPVSPTAVPASGAELDRVLKELADKEAYED